MNSNLNYKEIASMNPEEVMTLFKTNREGLSEEEVSNRLEEYGKNIRVSLKVEDKKVWKIFQRKFMECVYKYQKKD